MGTENIKLGTCSISYDGDDMGVTMGGVEVEVSTTTRPSKVDQFGETTVKEKITGRSVTVKVPMAETTVENLAKVMPGANLVIDAGDASIKKVVVSTGIGTDLLAGAKKLVLHPIDLPEGDKSEDLTVMKAATPGGMNFAYKIDQERLYNADFTGYPDSNGDLFIYGDEAATA